MNVLKGLWPRLKYGALPLVYLFTVHFWFSFNVPFYTILGDPWNTIASVIVNILVALFFIVIFLFPEKYVAFFSLGRRMSARATLINNISVMTVALIGTFIFWYTDFYNMPNIYYVLFYVHFCIMFALMGRAVERGRKLLMMG